MKPLSERLKDFPNAQFVDWMCLACVDVREVRTPDDAQEEINKIRDAVTGRLASLTQRAEAAEAKLAERDKQRNPDYFLNRIESSDKWGPEVELRIYESQLDASKSQDDHGGGIIELFTRPAPAISLAELVPDEMTWNRAHSLLDINQCGEDRFSAFMMGANYNRAAILRNIEEAK